MRLAEIYHDANELYKCRDVIDKFVDHARTQGDRLQYVDALDVILPGSPIYSVLEGSVPAPGKTYELQAQIVEAEEKKRINTLIGERRTRIGARVAEVTIETKREVYSQSRLLEIYQNVINWATDDDVRRTYEEKQLQYCYDRMLAWPPGEQKDQEAATVRRLANDMVIIRHPFKFAWDIAINWQDNKEVKQWDPAVLRQYCTFFPDSDLSRVIMGYLTSEISPFPKESAQPTQQTALAESDEDESEDDEEGGGVPTTYVPLTEEDRLAMFMEGSSSADSLFALRLTAEYYLHIEEHEMNVELMRKAVEHLKLERSRTGFRFQHTEDAFSLALGTSLVFYQSPRHHQEAKALFDKVLSHDPSSTPALIGVGLIYEEEEEYTEAIDFLERALQRDPSNLRVRTEAAWVKALNGDFATAKAELQACLPQLEKAKNQKELLAQTQYRVGHCIWNLDTSKAARKSRTGAYAYFLEALKNNLNYAPAYTALGIYYADYAKDKKRARRCFQKAVELSPSEVYSAERLARSFADDGDWDRVELVAQRVVDSGKVKPPPGSKRKGISWPFAALGVAELNKQDYRKAIVSFQAALRIAPEDYHSWVGLGEAYHGSGRYIAATKAILNAQRLEETARDKIQGETWFSRFILADIKRELGEFDEAIALYKAVADEHPDEQGVVIALMQAMVESAMDSLDKGFFGKAVDLAKETLKVASQACRAIQETFNFWKAVGDACSIFSSVRGRLSEFPLDIVQQILSDEDLAPSNGVPGEQTDSSLLYTVLQATITSHTRAIQVSAHDVHAQAVAHYNLGWAEFRAHTCLPSQKKSSPHLKTAIACFKRAIELEAGNAEFWNALGVVTSTVNPAVAQHAFVRSLHINEAGAHVWTNLGALALLQGDVQLANEAFTKAQSADPDYAHAWLGQGLVALLVGDVKEARGLFTHAASIAEASSRPVRRHYAVAMFDMLLAARGAALPITALLQPLLALSQLAALEPGELGFSHLLGLMQERNGEPRRAVETLEGVCGRLEERYERTEAATDLKHFAITKADLARARLAAGEYEAAVEDAEMALQLSEEGSELTAEERARVRLSAHVTTGVAKYFLQSPAEAVTALDAALDESNSDPDVACLLAQILWAEGSEASRERARDVLFGVVEATSPPHVRAVVLLGVIALLDGDEEGLEAVVSELQGLRGAGTSDGDGQGQGKGLSVTEMEDIGIVLRAVAGLGSLTTETSTEVVTAQDQKASQARQDVMYHPWLPHGWSGLAASARASATDDEGEELGRSAAEMALRVAVKGVPPRGELEAEDLAKAYAGTGRVRDAQVAVWIAPWCGEGWASLRGGVAGKA